MADSAAKKVVAWEVGGAGGGRGGGGVEGMEVWGRRWLAYK